MEHIDEFLRMVVTDAERKHGRAERISWVCGEDVPEALARHGADTEIVATDAGLLVKRLLDYPIAMNSQIPHDELALVRDGVIVAKLGGIVQETERAS